MSVTIEFNGILTFIPECFGSSWYNQLKLFCKKLKDIYCVLSAGTEDKGNFYL